MTDLRPSFPLACLDVRKATFLPEGYLLLVLNGTASPTARPIFSWKESTCETVVDNQGWWGSHEWSQLPQLYDEMSPWLACIPVYRDTHHLM